ncbi:UDP-glucosyltransferase 29 [Linum grandiflorum]
MPHLKSAFDSEATRASFSSVLVSVSPDLLIYDFLQPWAPQLASSLLHIPAVMFLCPSAAMCSFEAHCSKFGLDNKLLEEIGVGVEVKREGRSGKVDRKEVGKVIREVVMVEKKENVVRRKAKEMSEVMKKKGDQEIDDVVRELLQLCRTTSVNYN